MSQIKTNPMNNTLRHNFDLGSFGHKIPIKISVDYDRRKAEIQRLINNFGEKQLLIIKHIR